jgi:hypothetical protein
MSCEDPLGGVVIERHDAQQGVNLFLGDEMAGLYALTEPQMRILKVQISP